MKNAGMFMGMELKTLIINAIIYLILTTFFIYLIVREKQLGEKIKVYRDKFSDVIVFKLKWVINENLAKYLYPVHFIILAAGVGAAMVPNLIPVDAPDWISNIRIITTSSLNMAFFAFANVIIVGYMIGSMRNIKAEKKGEKKQLEEETLFDRVRGTGPANLAATLVVAAFNHFMTPKAEPFTMVDVLLIVNFVFVLIYIFTSERVIRKFVDIFETLITAVVLVLVIQYFYIGNFLVPTGSMEPTIMPQDRLFGNMIVYKFSKPKRGDILVFKEPVDDKLMYTKRLIGVPGDRVKIGDDMRVYINGLKVTGEKFIVHKKDIEFVKKMSKIELETGRKIVAILDEDKKRYEQYTDGVLERNYYSEGMIALAPEGWVVPKKGDTIEYDAVNKRLLLNGKDETGIIPDLMKQDDVKEKLLKGEKVTLTEDYYYVMGDNSGNSHDSRYWGFVAEHRISGKPFLRFWPLNRAGFIN